MDWTGRLLGIVESAATIQADSFIIDGELIGTGGNGSGGAFYDIPTSIKRDEVCVVAFDLMHLDGRDTRTLPLLERRTLLRPLVEDESSIVFSEAFPDGAALLREADERGLEGIV